MSQPQVQVAARPEASELLRERIDNALLVCADQLLAEGRWAFCCRVRKPDGSALDGLEIKAN